MYECVFMCGDQERCHMFSSITLRLIFLNRAFMEPRIDWWPANPSDPPVSVPTAQGLQVCISMPGFLMGSGVKAQTLMLMKQGLLRHPFSPSSVKSYHI